MRSAVLFIVLAITTGCAGGVAPAPSGPAAGLEAAQPWQKDQTVAFINGWWFDGQRFAFRERVLVADRRFVIADGRKAGQTVDLSGRFVIPPIGDGHTHSFDGPWGLPAQRKQFLDDGIFYAMTMTAPSVTVAKIRDQLTGPKNVDVATSMGGITGPESHPAEIYEANALGYYSYEQQLQHAGEIRGSRKMIDNAYFVVADKNDVDEKWPLIRSFGPDFIKIYLRSSERYDEGWGKWGAGGGVDPRLLPYIVSRADQAGLRSAVAVSSAYDFSQAVRAGADIATHPPCYQDTSAPGPYHDVNTAEECLIRPEDAALAGKQRMWTVAITSEWANHRPTAIVEWEQRNIATLRAAGAPISIGSNAYGSTPVEGLVEGARKGLYPALDILRWATVDTPRMIFPGRNVGCLDAGCEASFLVLDGNPLTDMGALEAIRLRVKDGLLLLPADYAGSASD